MAAYLVNPRLKLVRARKKPLAELILALGLGAYFKPTYEFQHLIDIRQSSTMRLALEGLLLSTMLPEAILSLFNHRFIKSLSKEDLEAYAGFFLDTTPLDPSSWHYHLATCEPEEAKVKLVVLQDPDDHPKARWAAGFPSVPEYASAL